MPDETFADGVAVVEMLMALYRSAELGRTITLPDPELETYVPPVARPRPDVSTTDRPPHRRNA